MVGDHGLHRPIASVKPAWSMLSRRLGVFNLDLPLRTMPLKLALYVVTTCAYLVKT
jgi:hypothetical protein